MASNKLGLIFEATDKAGLWYCVYEGSSEGRTLWEAWAWEAQTDPPTELHQSGYRFRQIGIFDSEYGS